MLDLDARFPRYRNFKTAVPVWCVTHGMRGCIHRFFDTSPFSPSGRYLAVFQLPFEDRQPAPGEKGKVIVIDLESGERTEVAETCGWEPQMGANINWGGSDRALFFNDVDTAAWEPFAWRVDFISGKRKKMKGTVYHASPDGRWLISANMASMRRTQPGYGVMVPEDTIPRNRGASDTEGFYLTDTETGERRLFASIRHLLDEAAPPVLIEEPARQEIYGFHSKFNPQGNRLMLSLRWYPLREAPLIDTFKNDPLGNRFAWITAGIDGNDIRCAAGPELWVKGGHHATWFPDGENISMNLNIDGDGIRFVRVGADGTGLRKMHDGFRGSGHPTVYPGGRYILTDAYVAEPLAFEDGTVPLRWLDLRTGEEIVLARIRTRTLCDDPVLRVDPHPAWDRSWRYVAFNAFVENTRQVFVADMGGLLGR